ncbi:MAG: glycosyltransferase family 39 protein [bacterium]
MFEKSKIVLVGILFLGLFFRLYGNNWDQGWHLHPDERFLTMVGVDVKIPSSIEEYLNPSTSSFNPVNKGHSFYVYGTFPVLLNKLFAQYLYNDTYDLFNLQGRVLSGIADFFVIIIIYKLIELVEKKLKFPYSIKYFSAFFYAIAVLPIQLSHFFAVDTFLNFFCWLSLYYAIKTVIQKKKTLLFNVCMSGVFFGLALACKISAIYVAPLIGVFILLGMYRVILVKTGIQSKIFNLNKDIRGWIPACAGITIFLFSCYFALRLGSPYYFETNTVFNPQLSSVFVNNLQTLKSFENPQALFPPAIQWLSKSFDFPIKNVIFFGVGVCYFLLSLIGLFSLLKKRNIFVTICILWVGLFFTSQSIQFAKTMRYLIFFYPFLAMFAAVGMVFIIDKTKKISKKFSYFSFVICLLSVLIWPVAFMSIYTKDHSRVTASRWIYNTIPSGSTILTEYWDDALPLTVENSASKEYNRVEVHIFDPDTKEKWLTINNQLKNANYYIMSSNRGWGSIMEVPEKYPLSSQFYRNMFANKQGYILVSKFVSYPSLRYLGIPLDFPDQWAEEAFTVYDHPEIMIFKKS